MNFCKALENLTMFSRAHYLYNNDTCLYNVTFHSNNYQFLSGVVGFRHEEQLLDIKRKLKQAEQTVIIFQTC